MPQQGRRYGEFKHIRCENMEWENAADALRSRSRTGARTSSVDPDHAMAARAILGGSSGWTDINKHVAPAWNADGRRAVKRTLEALLRCDIAVREGGRYLIKNPIMIGATRRLLKIAKTGNG